MWPFSTGQVAKILGTSVTEVIRLIDSGKLKGYRLPGSRHRRVTKESLVEFMNTNNIPLYLLET